MSRKGTNRTKLSVNYFGPAKVENNHIEEYQQYMTPFIFPFNKIQNIFLENLRLLQNKIIGPTS